MNDQNNEFSIDQNLTLMSIYLNEFKFRVERMWSQTFKLFYATLVVILLPNISGLFSLDMTMVPVVMFRIIGLIMALTFLYVSLFYAKTLKASLQTYEKINSSLPVEHQRVRYSSLKFGKLFGGGMAYTLTFLLAFALLAVDVLLLVYKI